MFIEKRTSINGAQITAARAPLTHARVTFVCRTVIGTVYVDLPSLGNLLKHVSLFSKLDVFNIIVSSLKTPPANILIIHITIIASECTY